MKAFYSVTLLFAFGSLASLTCAQDKPTNRKQQAGQNKERVAVKDATVTMTENDNTDAEIKKFNAYVKKNSRRIHGKNGTVLLTFTNEPSGSITNIKVSKSLNGAADEEALRLLKGYRRWEPNTVNGVRKGSTLTIPVSLYGDKNDSH